jgi:hypothetical protein
MPLHPNVRRCTHIQITGHRCGSPALKQEYFCYFHTRMIKGVQTRVDSQIHPMALIENAEAIQAAIMHTIDAVLKGTIDNKRANIVLKALYIAVRNSRNVYFRLREDDMVREVPNYAQQYLTEHPELNPPEPNPHLPNNARVPNAHVAPDTPVRAAERSSAGSSQELSLENQARENASLETESLNPPPTSTDPTQPQLAAPKKNNHQKESHPERAHKRDSKDPHAASSANPASGNSSNRQERGHHKAQGQQGSQRQEHRQHEEKKENYEPEDHQEESHPERTCHVARVEDPTAPTLTCRSSPPKIVAQGASPLIDRPDHIALPRD